MNRCKTVCQKIQPIFDCANRFLFNVRVLVIYNFGIFFSLIVFITGCLNFKVDVLNCWCDLDYELWLVIKLFVCPEK